MRRASSICVRFLPSPLALGVRGIMLGRALGPVRGVVRLELDGVSCKEGKRRNKKCQSPIC